jgi:hypothetical protein
VRKTFPLDEAADPAFDDLGTYGSIVAEDPDVSSVMIGTKNGASGKSGSLEGTAGVRSPLTSATAYEGWRGPDEGRDQGP